MQLPGVDTTSLPGVLVAIEGESGEGLAEQLADWLERDGHAVLRSRGEQGASPLLQCADLAERLELEIVPALRAGFYVLCDGYIQALREHGKWMQKVAAFALQPSCTLASDVTLTEAKAQIAAIRGEPRRPSAGPKRRSGSPSHRS